MLASSVVDFAFGAGKIVPEMHSKVSEANVKSAAALTHVRLLSSEVLTYVLRTHHEHWCY